MTTTSSNEILVGVDGSPDARRAVEWAAREAVSRNLSLTLVHVAPNAEMQLWLEYPVTDEFRRIMADQDRRVMAEAGDWVAAATSGSGPVTVSERSISGNAVATLVGLSEGAELVVVGSRGLGAIKRRLLGSVSSGLIRHAHCPVAVIHDEGPAAREPGRAPVVVGIDGSPASELATAIAFDQASRRRVELIAVHAWSDPTVYAYPNEEWMALQPRAEQLLAERLAGWHERYPDVSVRRLVVRDRPARQLLEQSEHAQLVVVGSHGRGGFLGMLLGSVSSAVAESARVPVIVARRG
jgi:nucleotide-binding universal stress UspA family protein